MKLVACLRAGKKNVTQCSFSCGSRAPGSGAANRVRDVVVTVRPWLHASSLWTYAPDVPRPAGCQFDGGNKALKLNNQIKIESLQSWDSLAMILVNVI